MFNRYALLIGAITIFLSACSQSNNNDKVLEALKLIKSDMAQMRKAISEVHSIAVRANGNAVNKKNTPPSNVKVSLSGGAMLGDEKAKFAIIEFSDFQCPFCARFHKQTFPAIKKDYIDTGKFKYVLKDYPLGFHAKAFDAAIAARCADEQNAYWEMKKSLFENQRNLNNELYIKLAKASKLDMKKFEACLVDPKQKEKIDKSILEGQSLAVNGTPHFFIGKIENGQIVNAKRVAGAQPYSSFLRVIKSLL